MNIDPPRGRIYKGQGLHVYTVLIFKNNFNKDLFIHRHMYKLFHNHYDCLSTEQKSE